MAPVGFLTSLLPLLQQTNQAFLVMAAAMATAAANQMPEHRQRTGLHDKLLDKANYLLNLTEYHKVESNKKE